MKLAANLSWLYADRPMPARFEAAARDGFAGVEVLWPYDEPAAAYAARLAAHGLELALINTPIDEGAGGRGFAAVPGARPQFERGFGQALEVALATGCRRIHVMAGDVDGQDANDVRSTLVANLEYALARAGPHGVQLMLEPLNRTDAPGYAYHRPREALDVVRALGSPLVRLQFDLYHCVMEGLHARDEALAASAHIGHVQIAGVPGRHEPDLARDHLLDALRGLRDAGYAGWIGCEYRPRADTTEGLAWTAPLQRAGLLG